MPTWTVAAGAVLIAGVAIGSATAAPSRDALVQPGRGIGKLRLTNATCSTWAGLGSNSSKETWIVISHPTGARTVFAAIGDMKADPGPVRVVEVMVQVPASGLSERRSGCGPDWRRL